MPDFKYQPTLLMLPTSHYDERRADFAVKFISMLKHTTGEWYGKPFHLMPWQERIVRDIFGIVDADGYRQFRTAYIEVGKKNGKSELAAAIALYLLFADGEAGAEVYSCAADINQASIVFNTAKSMVEQCVDLNRLSKLIPSTKWIIFPHTNSFYRVLSSETKSKQGFNISGLIFDELFAQQTRELFDTMTKYTGDARRQPLYFLITTAGRERTSICYEIHCKAKASRPRLEHGQRRRRNRRSSQCKDFEEEINGKSGWGCLQLRTMKKCNITLPNRASLHVRAVAEYVTIPFEEEFHGNG